MQIYGKKHIELQFSSSTDFADIYKKIEDYKEKILEKVNKDRKNEDIDENYIKTLNKNNKLDPKVKETRKIKQIDRLKYKDNYKTYHKDQFIKKKKYFRNRGTDQKRQLETILFLNKLFKKNT